MQSFSLFVTVHDLIAESLLPDTSIFLEADPRRYTSPEEWAHVSSELQKKKDAGKAFPLTQDVLAKTGKEATPVTKMLQPLLTTATNAREIVKGAWERNGLEADPQTVIDDMKKRGEQIIPDPSYIQSYGVSRLKELRDKLMVDPDAELGDRENKIVDIWQRLSSGDIVGRSGQGKLQLHPDHVFDYLEKIGMRDLAITDNEAELEFIDNTHEDIVSGHLPVGKQAGTKSAMRKMVSRMLGRVDPRAEKEGEKGVTSMRPENVYGLKQWLDKGGDPDDLPNTYTGFKQNVPSYDYKADPDVIAQYRDDRDLWLDQIVKPACLAASKRLRSIAAEVASGGGSATSIALGSYIDPSKEPAGSDGSYCGLGNNPKSAEMLRLANDFLEDGDGSFDGVVRDIIKGLENSTNWVDPKTGDTWMEREAFRQNRASWLALRAFDKIYTTLKRRKRGEVGKASGEGAGKVATPAEIQDREEDEQAAEDALIAMDLPPKGEAILKKIMDLDYDNPEDKEKLEILALELMPMFKDSEKGLAFLKTIMKPAA